MPDAVRERCEDIESLRRRREVVRGQPCEDAEQIRFLRPLLEDNLVAEHEAYGARPLR
jgi:hypothetical protein